MKKHSFVLVILCAMLFCGTSALAATSLEAEIIGKPFSPKLFHVYASPNDAKYDKVDIICGYDDDVIVERLLSEGWAQVRLTVEGDPDQGYCDAEDVLVNPDFDASLLTVSETSAVYSRYDCSAQLGSMAEGDTCILIGIHDGHSQVLWQTGAGEYRIAWLKGAYGAEDGHLTRIPIPETSSRAWRIRIEKLFLLFLCHLVGDYVLQSAYLAQEKKRSWWHLLVHCCLYTVPFYACFSMCWQLACILIGHFIIDAIKARKERIHLAQDQALHIALLLLYFL